MQSYHVVHRIASYPDVHGIFSDIMDFSFSRDTNIRIDTHKDNHIMQHNIEKHGFTYCGIIYLVNGDERLAYQKMRKEPVFHQKSFQELTVDKLYELQQSSNTFMLDGIPHIKMTLTNIPHSGSVPV